MFLDGWFIQQDYGWGEARVSRHRRGCGSLGSTRHRHGYQVHLRKVGTWEPRRAPSQSVRTRVLPPFGPLRGTKTIFILHSLHISGYTIFFITQFIIFRIERVRFWLLSSIFCISLFEVCISAMFSWTMPTPTISPFKFTQEIRHPEIFTIWLLFLHGLRLLFGLLELHMT
jgi:hypothetical protein